MCGIVGYLGRKQAAPLLLESLKRLEYRGYDSAGISVSAQNGSVATYKSAGRIETLTDILSKKTLRGTFGIAHTRWATHGAPTSRNAHPHTDCKNNIFLIHNGIIENYQQLKENLIKEGHKFLSQTDSEVLTHLIEKFYKGNLEEAVISALKLVCGTYGLAVIAKDSPRKIVAARNSSPVLIGLGNNEFIVTSDASAILSYAKEVVYLGDREVAVISDEGIYFTNLSQDKVDKKSHALEWDEKDIQKEGYDYFMEKEIFQQPESLRISMTGRLIEKDGLVKLGGLETVQEKLRDIKRLVIVGCGTAYLAGQVGEYMIEEYAGIPVEVEYASEFRYRKSVLDKKTALICISQSGETADTLAALQEVKRKGIMTLGVVNVVGSSIARATDAGIYCHVGPEVGVASTKAFTSQLCILALLTLFLGRQRQMSFVTGRRIIKELKVLPRQIEDILKQAPAIKKIAKKYSKAKNFFFLGRKYNYPIAVEGALKLKEISYLHAEGYGAGEMKHGPLAMIDKNFPTIGVVPSDSVYEKMLSNLEEINARKGPIIAVATKGNKDLKRITEDIFYIPKTLEMLTPILSVVPLQLFAYYTAVEKGCDIDKPRNLAKSVTVE